jgi:AraC-like DNA-binding protein
MPSTKPELKARVGDEVKRAFHAAAEAHGLTESRLLEKLVETFLKRGDATPPPTPKPEPETAVRSRQAHARLTPAEHAELGRVAATRGMSRGTYLAELFRANVYEQPRFSDVEINALHQAAAQLAAVGRNINQIARALNTSLDEAHRATALDFEHLKNMIDEQRAYVNDLVRSNMRSWGVNTDGE